MQSKITEILEFLKEKYYVDFDYEVDDEGFKIIGNDYKLSCVIQHIIYDVLKITKEKLNLDYAYVLDESIGQNQYVFTKSFNEDELV